MRRLGVVYDLEKEGHILRGTHSKVEDWIRGINEGLNWNTPCGTFY